MIEDIKMEMFKKDELMRIYFGEEEFIDLKIFKLEKSRFLKFNESARDAFAIILKGPKNMFFSQGCYSFEHPNMGIELIAMTQIVSPGGDRESNYYELLFS